MIYLLALLPATALTVAGYVVLFLSHRAEGALRTFGRYLGFWAFTLAGLVILGALFAAAHGGHRGMYGMHGRHCPWAEESRVAPRGTEPPPMAEPPEGSPPEAPPPPAPAAH